MDTGCETSGMMPPFGQRLLPRVVDQHAHNCPERLFGLYARSDNDSYEFYKITMKQVASAVDFIAWWIKKFFGLSADFETLAYMGIPDFRYTIVCLAAIKCGFKVLLASTQSSLVQIRSLLQTTLCSKLIYSQEMSVIVEKLGVETTASILDMETILTSKSAHFPFEKNYHTAEKDPILVVHSSGTTGTPKIIIMTHGTVSVTDNDRFVGCPEGRKPQNGAQFNFKSGGGFYSCFPPYHLAGIQAYIVLPIFSTSASVILGPPQIPPTGELMAEIIREQRHFLRAFYVPPSIIEQWVQTPESSQQAMGLEFILYGGGPLSRSTGDKLSQVTDVCQMYGSAETGQIQLLVPKKDDWAYMEWNPFEEVDMQLSTQGAFELVLHQQPKFLQHRSLSHNFPEVKEWRSGDLFLPHLVKPGLWKYHGRVDDILVLSNGHKINPVTFETNILRHPEVSGSLLVGTGKTQPALLIELKENFLSETEIFAQIWPVIEQENLSVPQHGQITPSKVMFCTSNKRFIRSPKGSIMRKSTIDLYGSEIEKLYDREHGSESAKLPALDASSLERILDWVRSSLSTLLPKTQLVDETDFLFAGMNSLKVVEYTAILRAALSGSKSSFMKYDISNSIIYRHPTISQLARAIESLKAAKPSTNIGDSCLKDLVQRNSQFKHSLAPFHVILTGVTGSLGSSVLSVLLQNPVIHKVFCLVRVRDGMTKNTLWEAYRHKFSETLHKIEIVEINLFQHHLGLNDAMHQVLTSKINVIIHLAWEVDFNMPLQSFEKTHIRGLRSIIELSISNLQKPRIIFASSISYATDWAMNENVHSIPEALLPNLDFESCSGYGKSKQAAEHILKIASTSYGVSTTILRLGQISGSSKRESSFGTEIWPMREWVPGMIQTSASLNLIPTSDIALDWIPVELVSEIIGDIVISTQQDTVGPFDVCNIVNTHPVSWSLLTDALQTKISTAEIVPLQNWVDVLLSLDSDDVSLLERYPSLKLRDFFRGLVEFERWSGSKSLSFVTEKSAQLSKTMVELPRLDLAQLL